MKPINAPIAKWIKMELIKDLEDIANSPLEKINTLITPSTKPIVVVIDPPFNQ